MALLTSLHPCLAQGDWGGIYHFVNIHGMDLRRWQVVNKESQGLCHKFPTSTLWGPQPREEFESGLRQGAEAEFKSRWRKADSLL